MRRFSLDSETFLLAPGIAAPRMVCLTTCDEDADAHLLLRDDALPLLHALFDLPDLVFVLHHARFDMAVFAAADPTLLPKIMRLYDEGRVRCTMVREKLLALARGELADEGETGAKRNIRFGLDKCLLRRFDLDISEDKASVKTDTGGKVTIVGDQRSWRLRYAELDGVPIEQWPEKARVYAMDDSRYNLALFDAQTAELQAEGGVGDVIPDEMAQTRAAFWLYLASVRGVRTDPVAVNALATKTKAQYARMNAIIRASDVLRPQMKKGEMVWARNMRAIKARVLLAYGVVADATGENVPKKLRTDGGDVATDRKTLNGASDKAVMAWIDETEVAIVAARKEAGLDDLTGDEMGQVAQDIAAAAGEHFGKPASMVYNWMILHALGDRSGVEKVLTTYVPILYQGTQGPICTKFNELVATGRGSSYEPNLQNPPRGGGVRECFVPRPGYVFALCDYSYVELVTLAQTCLDLFGWSSLAVAINNGLDPHTDMAADDLGITYEEAKRRLKAGDEEMAAQRQRAKARNFGFPGGLGAKTYVDYAVGYGVFLTEAEAKQEKDKWFRKWPEMRAYYDHFGRLTQGDRKFTAVQLPTGRIRGDVGFCDGANTQFQGRAADGIKRAGWNVTKECYLPDPYPLGTRFSMGCSAREEPIVQLAVARLRAGLAPGSPSPLYGSRVVLFLHDELVLESPEDKAAEAVKRMSDIMIAGMREVVSDVAVGTEYALCRRWYKGAKPLYDAAGRMIPWAPKAKAA